MFAPRQDPLMVRRARGFTLIELMVTVTVLGVLTALAAPAFQSAFLTSRLASFSNDFSAAVQLARSEAIKRNSNMKLCRSSNGNSCAASGGWQQGWIVFADTDDDGTVGAGETRVQYRTMLDERYSFTGNAYTLTFMPTGLTSGSASADLTLCRSQPSPGDQERLIAVSASGRVKITRSSTGTCT